MALYVAPASIFREPKVAAASPVASQLDALDVPSSPHAWKCQQSRSPPPHCRSAKIHPPSRYLAVAAQVVFTGVSPRVPMVVRVSVTDYNGNVLLDTFVRPTHPVTDYRTGETGLHPEHVAGAPPFHEVQGHLSSLIRDRIVVGHELWHFLSVTGIRHPAIDTRDVANYTPFRRRLRSGRQFPPLPVLINRLMGRSIGLGHEHPLENARAALDLFRSAEQTWEGSIGAGTWPCSLPPVTFAEYFL